VLVLQPPILEMVSQKQFCHCLIKEEKKLKKPKQHKTKQKNPTKCSKFKCNTVSVSFSACRYSSVVVSSKVGRKKKESGDSSVNGYLRLWLTCLLLSGCCCWRLYLFRSLG
jgi:hypothetical protein